MHSNVDNGHNGGESSALKSHFECTLRAASVCRFLAMEARPSCEHASACLSDDDSALWERTFGEVCAMERDVLSQGPTPSRQQALIEACAEMGLRWSDFCDSLGDDDESDGGEEDKSTSPEEETRTLAHPDRALREDWGLETTLRKLRPTKFEDMPYFASLVVLVAGAPCRTPVMFVDWLRDIRVVRLRWNGACMTTLEIGRPPRIASSHARTTRLVACWSPKTKTFFANPAWGEEGNLSCECEALSFRSPVPPRLPVLHHCPTGMPPCTCGKSLLFFTQHYGKATGRCVLLQDWLKNDCETHLGVSAPTFPCLERALEIACAHK